MEVLLVEDDVDDAVAVVRLAAKSALNVRVTTASTGDEAMRELTRRHTEPRSGGRQPPDLVLLDLDLPARPGLDVLRWIKCDEQLRQIPVVILSGSDDDRAIEQGRALGAHSHIAKPISLASLTWIITAIGKYQSRITRLPAPG